MKSIFTILLVLFSFHLSFSQNYPDGPFKDYYDSGELKVEGQYKNKKRVGAWKSYYKNGQISKLYSYKNGKRNKINTSYYKDGIVKSKTEKIGDEYIGTGFYKSGKLKYKRQVETGYYNGYFESGAIKTEANYLEFDLIDEWKRFYENGQLAWLVTYKDGYRHGAYKHYYQNGDIKLEGSNSKDKVDGEEKRFLINNVLEWEGNYSKGLMNKTWTKFNTNGDEIEKIKYKKGVASNSLYTDLLIPTKVAEGVTDIIPIYPGCEDSLTNKTRKACMNRNVNSFIVKNFNKNIAKNLTSGKKRIIVNFKADKNGNIEIVKVVAPSVNLQIEAYRVIKLLPKLTPALQNGKFKIFPFSIPIVFQVQ